MHQVDGPPRRPGPQVHAATLTTATAGLIIWTTERYLFHGAEVPGPVYVFVQLAVPALLGRLGAEWAYRRARHRLDAPRRP
jgi:hypothetical protein